MEITNETDPARDYINAVDNAENLDQLQAGIYPYQKVCDDAYTASLMMNDNAFPQFRAGLVELRLGKSPNNEWYESWAAIALPDVLASCTCVSVFYKIPWGMAYLRLLAAGFIEQNDLGVASMKRVLG